MIQISEVNAPNKAPLVAPRQQVLAELHREARHKIIGRRATLFNKSWVFGCNLLGCRIRRRAEISIAGAHGSSAAGRRGISASVADSLPRCWNILRVAIGIKDHRTAVGKSDKRVDAA